MDWLGDIVIDSLNNIWISTSNTAGLIKFDGTNWTSFNFLNSGIGTNILSKLKIDNLGNLWIGTGNNGVVKFDGINWTIYNSSNSLIPFDHVLGLGIDKQNNLWVGTWGGASYFDGTNWTLFTTENSGLPHNDVRDFEFDQFGNVWIGTGGGGIGVYNENGVALNLNENELGFSSAQFKMFPVPFNDNFQIEIETHLIGSNLVLYDALGNETGNYILNHKSTSIQPLKGGQGIYFYKIIHANKLLESGKIVRLH